MFVAVNNMYFKRGIYHIIKQQKLNMPSVLSTLEQESGRSQSILLPGGKSPGNKIRVLAVFMQDL